MKTSSSACQNQTAKSFKFPKEFQIAALRFFLKEALQALKETPDDSEKKFFNTNEIHSFQVLLFEHFYLQLNDQIDSDSIINTLQIFFLNQNQSLDTFHEHKNTDTEKFKNEVVNVITETEFDFSCETEISTNLTLLAPYG